jgi:uncharacterized protein YidB (DUF937 family)
MSDTRQEHDQQTGQAPRAAPQEGRQGQPNLAGMITGLLGGQGGGAAAKLVPAVLGMVSASGGLGGLLEKLKQGGLGEQTKSWVSPDSANAKVSGDQLTDALGQEHMDKLADQAGVSPQEAAGGLAQMLPGAVDKLTPQGEVPKEHGGFDVEQVKTQVAKLLGGNR